VHHGKRIAVTENEFGETGIDHELVVGAEEEQFRDEQRPASRARAPWNPTSSTSGLGDLLDWTPDEATNLDPNIQAVRRRSSCTYDDRISCSPAYWI
jgi:hypothetical protein